MPIQFSTRALLLVIPMIPSVLVTIFNLYHFLTNRALRKALNNHVVILLLICGLIDELTGLLWTIYFYRTGTALSSTPAFCSAWVVLGSSMYIVVYILMAWASIERHILIFYPNLFGSKPKRLFFHYLPLATCILWPVLFYFVTLIVLPCSTTFKYNRSYCGRYSCLLNIPWASLVDSIANYIVPAFTVVLFSMALFVRVLYTRYRIRGRVDWRNYKKMAGQLLPISLLYLLLQFPPTILYAAYTAGLLPTTVGSSYYNDSLFFTNWVVLFTPFATAVSLPELKTKCKKLLFWRRRHAVRPETLAMTRRNVGQTVAVAVERPVVARVVVATEAVAPSAVAAAVVAQAKEAVTVPATVASETTAPEATALEATAPEATALEATAPEAKAPTAVALGAMTSTSMLASPATALFEMPPVII